MLTIYLADLLSGQTSDFVFPVRAFLSATILGTGGNWYTENLTFERTQQERFGI